MVGKGGDHRVDVEAGLGHAQRELLGFHCQRLLVKPALANRFALLQGLRIALLAGLLETAQLVVDAFQRGAGGGLCLFSAHALIQCGLAFVLQCLDRGIAIGQLQGQVAEA